MSLARFHEAQDTIWVQARAELNEGRKTGHWMWFIFPQLASLGRSVMARHYGLSGLDEARDYLADPVLRERLVEAARAVLGHPDLSAESIMGGIDAIKLRSSMTLFEAADPGIPEFGRVIDTFYDGERDPLTRSAL